MQVTGWEDRKDALGFRRGSASTRPHIHIKGRVFSDNQIERMYLLYLDESGTHSSARHFILAGVAVHESNLYWIKERLDGAQNEYFPDGNEPIQFHAAPLRTSDADKVSAPFDKLDSAARSRLLSELYQITNEIYGVFFAIVIEKIFLDESQGKRCYHASITS